MVRVAIQLIENLVHGFRGVGGRCFIAVDRWHDELYQWRQDDLLEYPCPSELCCFEYGR